MNTHIIFIIAACFFFTSARSMAPLDISDERLYTAAQHGNCTLIAQALDEGALVNTKDPHHGLTPLLIAGINNHTTAALQLLNQGADPRATTPDGYTLLHIAAKRGNVPLLRKLLKKNIDINAASASGSSALLCAATNPQKNTNAVRLLLDSGADIDQDAHGLTPLMGAIISGNIAIVQLLLLKNADTHSVIPLETGYRLSNSIIHHIPHARYLSTFILAAVMGRTEIIELLLNNGIEVNRHDLTAAFLLIAKEGNAPMVKLFLERFEGISSDICTEAFDLVQDYITCNDKSTNASFRQTMVTLLQFGARANIKILDILNINSISKAVLLGETPPLSNLTTASKNMLAEALIFAIGQRDEKSIVILLDYLRQQWTTNELISLLFTHAALFNNEIVINYILSNQILGIDIKTLVNVCLLLQQRNNPTLINLILKTYVIAKARLICRGKKVCLGCLKSIWKPFPASLAWTCEDLILGTASISERPTNIVDRLELQANSDRNLLESRCQIQGKRVNLLRQAALPIPLSVVS